MASSVTCLTGRSLKEIDRPPRSGLYFMPWAGDTIESPGNIAGSFGEWATYLKYVL